MKTLRLPFGAAVGVMFVLAMGAAVQVASQTIWQDTIHVEVTFYDFRSDRSNPEFEVPHQGQRRTGMVAQNLDRDGKPVMGSNPYLNHGIRFWFRDWSNLSGYGMRDSMVTTSGGPRSYLDRFRPIYIFDGNNNRPPPDREQMGGSAGIDEWSTSVRTGVTQVPYFYADGSTNSVALPSGVSHALTGPTNNRNITVGNRSSAFNIDSSFVNRVFRNETLVFHYVRGTDGLYTFERRRGTNQFFPLNNPGTLHDIGSPRNAARGFGNEWHATNTSHSPGRNFSYTMELVRDFIMADNLTFDFSGDDDVWVFIGPKGQPELARLVMDIGGIHEEVAGGFRLEDLRQSLGLENGREYTMYMFYCERHSDDANIMITTNLVRPGLREIVIDLDHSDLRAGDSVLANTIISVDTGNGTLWPTRCGTNGRPFNPNDPSTHDPLNPGSPHPDCTYDGTFTWTIRDTNNVNDASTMRLFEPGRRNSTPRYRPGSANDVYIYAERAHTVLEVTVTYREGTEEVSKTVYINVLPGPIAGISIEGQWEGSGANLWEAVPIDPVVIPGDRNTNSDFYAIQRDRFGNYIGPANTTTTATLAWSTGDSNVATARQPNTTTARQRGQGEATRVLHQDTSTQLIAVYTVNGTPYRDTTNLRLTSLGNRSIEIGVMHGGAFIPARSLTGRTIDMTIPSDTTLYARLTLTNGTVVYAPVRWRGDNGIMVASEDTLGATYQYSAQTPVTGGIIRGEATCEGVPCSDHVVINARYSAAQSMRFYTRRTPSGTTPPLINPLDTFPPTPAGTLRLYATPTNQTAITPRVRVRANESMPIVAALFATATPAANSFLPNYQTSSPPRHITWRFVTAGDNRAIDPATPGSRLTLDTISGSGDSVVFHSTWATYDNHFRLRATYSEVVNGVQVMVSQDILIAVMPGDPNGLFIEASAQQQSSPNTANPIDEIVFTTGMTRQQAFAILRDQWGNYVRPSGANYVDGVPPTTWTTENTTPDGTDVVIPRNGFIPSGEGILEHPLAGSTTLRARDTEWNLTTTVPVHVRGFYYDDLMIVKRNPDGTYSPPAGDSLQITTNDDDTLYVLGRRTDDRDGNCTQTIEGDCWDLVRVDWDRDQGLAFVFPTPPRNSNNWILSPRIEGEGNITVSMQTPAGVVGDSLKVTVTAGAPTSVELVILTPLGDIRAGQPIEAEVRYYNRAGRLTTWNPAWGPGATVFVDTLGCGPATLCTNHPPQVVSGTRTGSDSTGLGYRGTPSWIPTNNATIKADTAAGDNATFYIYFAADGHQIRFSQNITNDNGQQVTLTAVSVPFTVRAGEVDRIVIEDRTGNEPDTVDLHQRDRPTEVLISVGYDEYGNKVGEEKTRWCVTGEIPRIGNSAAECRDGEVELILYDITNATDNGRGQICVTYTRPSDGEKLTDCVEVKVDGVSLYALHAITRDIDGDGYLDRIDVHYSRPVRFAPGNSVTNAATFITVAVPSPALNFPVARVEFNSEMTTMFIHLTQASSGNLQTAMRPNITIARDIFDGSDLADEIRGDRVRDGAPPVILRALKYFDRGGDARKDYIVVHFSEPVRSRTNQAFNIDRGYRPDQLFRLWEVDMLSKTASRARTRRAAARAAHLDNTAYREISDLLTGIAGIIPDPQDPSIIRFDLTNGRDVKIGHFINIMTDPVTDNVAAAMAANPAYGDTSTVRDGVPNHPQRVNRRVPITRGDPEDSRMVSVPNPASPDKRPVGPSSDHRTITVVHNPAAIGHIRGGGGGAMFQVPIYIPNDAPIGAAAGPNSAVRVRVQVKVYDLAGNLVNASENPNVLASFQGMGLAGGDRPDMHLYWHGFNSKGMKAAPGTYRIIAYVSYIGSNDPNRPANRKYTSTLGLSK